MKALVRAVARGVSVVALVAGCTNPDLDAVVFPCGEGGACGEGHSCVEGLCRPGTWLPVACDPRCEHGGICEGGACQCPPGFAGGACEVDVDDCEPDPCQHGGICEDRVDGYLCHCALGYGGDDCEVVLAGCDPDPCQNGGACVDEGGGVRCLCAPGYEGDACERAIDPCAEESCARGRVCEVIGGVAACVCPEGRGGDDCAPIADPCAPNPCGRGACTVEGAAARCVCPRGYGGVGCAQPVCEPSCVEGACVAPDTCDCDSGYEGAACDVPVCATGCVHGDCVAPDTCACAVGYEGAACDLPICATGCVHGDCVAPDTCDCDSGYEGAACDVPVCPGGCLDGDCVAPGVCGCPDGWVGPECECELAGVPFGGGDGSEENPFRLCAPEHWVNLGVAPDAHHALHADLDLDGYAVAQVGLFTGVLDGRGHTVHHLTMNASPIRELSGTVRALRLRDAALTVGGDSGGLVRWTTNGAAARISDVHLHGTIVSAGAGVGGLAWQTRAGSVVEDVAVDIGVTITSAPPGGGFSGGIVASQRSGSVVRGAVARGTIATEGSLGVVKIGGMVGEFWNDTGADPVLEACANFMTIELPTSNRIGGLIGVSLGGVVRDCHNAGAVAGFEWVGGLIGESGHQKTTHIVRSYNRGPVARYRADGAWGPVVGMNKSTSVTDVFYDSETSLATGGVGTPRTTAQMQDPATFPTFAAPWILTPGQYPRLANEAAL